MPHPAHWAAHARLVCICATKTPHMRPGILLCVCVHAHQDRALLAGSHQLSQRGGLGLEQPHGLLTHLLRIFAHFGASMAWACKGALWRAGHHPTQRQCGVAPIYPLPMPALLATKKLAVLALWQAHLVPTTRPNPPLGAATSHPDPTGSCGNVKTQKVMIHSILLRSRTGLSANTQSSGA